MTDSSDLLPPGPDTGARPGSNLPEYSVAEISTAVKRTIEDAYGHVRVRGEISRPSFPRSGHIYLNLKDDQAVLGCVIWRMTASRLALRPEEGLEVIATGRLTTYPGQSKYQLVIESLELAGEGALLKMLEERRRRLTAEGLFEEARKRPLPFLPRVIGVVTSPTGAVIRDILHRLADRFPRHVLLWPVSVQGETAAAQVAAAIEGFNSLPVGGPIPRPDVLIVARGGGSLEDLMAFNEEVAVRAAASSAIPLISAVGHETDTTLIDLAADRRAPTPSAAAEIAVPVRSELLARVLDRSGRLEGATARFLSQKRTRVADLARGLGDPRRLLEGATQRLDDRAERLALALPALMRVKGGRLAEAAARLPHPRQRLLAERRHLAQLADRMRACAGALGRRRQEGARRLADQVQRLDRAAGRRIVDAGRRLASAGALLESYSYRSVLRRGYAAVLDREGQPVTTAEAAREAARIRLRFADGDVGAVIEDAPARPSGPGRRKPSTGTKQGDLF